MTALGVLCCFALFVCLTLLASFFLPSHLSFKNMYIYMNLWLTLYVAYRVLSSSLGVRQCLEHKRDTVSVAEYVVADLLKDEGHVSRKRLPVTPRFLKGRRERGGREREKRGNLNYMYKCMYIQ